MSLLKSKKAEDALGRSTTETMAYLTERNRRFQQFLEEKLVELAKKTVPGQTDFMSNEPALVVEEAPQELISNVEETTMPLQGKWLGVNPSPPSIETNALAEETSRQEASDQEKAEAKAEAPLPNWQDLLGNSATPAASPIPAASPMNEEEAEEMVNQAQKTPEADLEEADLEEVDPSTWDTSLNEGGELDNWD